MAAFTPTVRVLGFLRNVYDSDYVTGMHSHYNANTAANSYYVTFDAPVDNYYNIVPTPRFSLNYVKMNDPLDANQLKYLHHQFQIRGECPTGGGLNSRACFQSINPNPSWATLSRYNINTYSSGGNLGLFIVISDGLLFEEVFQLGNGINVSGIPVADLANDLPGVTTEMKTLMSDYVTNHSISTSYGDRICVTLYKEVVNSQLRTFCKVTNLETDDYRVVQIDYTGDLTNLTVTVTNDNRFQQKFINYFLGNYDSFIQNELIEHVYIDENYDDATVAIDTDIDAFYPIGDGYLYLRYRRWIRVTQVGENNLPLPPGVIEGGWPYDSMEPNCGYTEARWLLTANSGFTPDQYWAQYQIDSAGGNYDYNIENNPQAIVVESTSQAIRPSTGDVTYADNQSARQRYPTPIFNYFIYQSNESAPEDSHVSFKQLPGCNSVYCAKGGYYGLGKWFSSTLGNFIPTNAEKIAALNAEDFTDEMYGGYLMDANMNAYFGINVYDAELALNYQNVYAVVASYSAANGNILLLSGNYNDPTIPTMKVLRYNGTTLVYSAATTGYQTKNTADGYLSSIKQHTVLTGADVRSTAPVRLKLKY